MSEWCTIESDPGVFTCLIQNFGVQNAQLTELYSLDDLSLQQVIDSYGKVHGLVFLFKWQQQQQQQQQQQIDSAQEHHFSSEFHENYTPIEENVPVDLFFAKQVIHNACATQALLSILLNASHCEDDPETDGSGDDTTRNLHEEQSCHRGSALRLGPILLALKSFTASFPPELKGEAIGASDEIRNVHNSFARKETFLVEESSKRVATQDDEVFHFIAYVPHANGIVYELDGLQSGPIPVGRFDSGDASSGQEQGQMNDFKWLTVARQAIQKRIEKYQTSEIKFNLMALTQDRRTFLQSQLKIMLDAGLNQEDGVIQQLHLKMMDEEDLRKQWEDENERRRHNYLPLCLELIRAFAKTGHLQEYIDKAKSKSRMGRGTTWK